MLREAQVSGLLATNCDFEPVADRKHFAVFQGTWQLSACTRQPQLEAHAAEKPHYAVNDYYRESGQRCGLSVVGVEFVAFATHPPACLGYVSFCFSHFFNDYDRLYGPLHLESTRRY
jgi:hypothetical protein